MPIIRSQHILADADDPWVSLADDAPIPASGHVLLSLSRFIGLSGGESPEAGLYLGVRLSPEDNPRLLAGKLSGISLITAQFPIFRDGRAYSQASILREMGYQGTLRAVGDVLVDQVFFMKRCGFDELALRPDKSTDDALRALNAFSFVYAAAPDQRPVVPQLRAAHLAGR